MGSSLGAMLTLAQGLLAAANPFDTINGLPLHPLVVHVPVVLLPLSALGAIIIAFVPRWSSRFGVLVWLGAGVSLAFALLAEKSGEALAQRVGNPKVHAELGEQLKFYAFGLLVVTFILWLVDRRGNRRTLLTKLLAALVILVALAAIWGTYRAGESGATAVWSKIIANTPTPTAG